MNLLSLLSLAVLLIQTGVNPLTQPKPAGSIEGTITRAGSNQPVIGARVSRIRRPTTTKAADPIPPTTTDVNGKFSFSALEDGVYGAQAEAEGYLPRPYGRLGPTMSMINVTGAQPVKDINVALTPKAIVSGRVRETSGQPLVNFPVQALRYSYDSQGRGVYQAEGTATTNDRGEYRIAWVKPGRYYLLAGKTSTGSTNLPRYAFYPDVLELANAVAIDLQPGMELPSMDLTLAAMPRTHTIRGKVLDSRTGQSPAQANVFAIPRMPGLNAPGDMYVNLEASTPNYDGKTGSFEIRNLLPGMYAIVAAAIESYVPEPRNFAQSLGLIIVSVASSDVDSLTIPVAPAGTIPGRVRADGQLPAQVTLDRIVIRLVPTGANAEGSLSGLMANVLHQFPWVRVAADGTFRFQNVTPGEYRIEFFLSSEDKDGVFWTPSMAINAYIKDARLDGVDVANAPLNFSGSTHNGLEITMASGQGRVEATVTDARLQRVHAGRVVAVPERARFRSDLYRLSLIGEDGRSFFTLPPGDYKFFAWESVEDNGWFDPELLARSEVRAVSLRVSASTTQAINVQINPVEAKTR